MIRERGKNNHVKFVDVIEARKDLRSHPRGAKIPITAGASGKVDPFLHARQGNYEASSKTGAA